MEKREERDLPPLKQSARSPDMVIKKETMGKQEPSERVYLDISNAIFEQRLKPGTKLGEQMLCEIFGVNRPVIRRALMRLSYETLVDIRPNRGAFVASPSPEDARQIFEARRAVEEWITRQCVACAGPSDIEHLHAHVAMEAEARRSGDRLHVIRLSGAFHLELANITKNSRMRRFLEELVAQTSLIISLYGKNDESLCDDDHARIVEAIAQKDSESAVKRICAHLDSCLSSLSFAEENDSTDLRSIFMDQRHYNTLSS
ncbi:GntR family transcriptional regulator [Iodidimonas gelatinilytica]|uniref:GntR family transcriptional regulator n=2 Tax=Iodidimonas gelatinilytica TaxID=1236966 RepID=A0A5A7ML51_9PROT|nr:GntR family transcriptional regulator [Iodidimonas gelatinilytica]